MVNEPESMEELIYFTNRSIDDGSARAWVYKGTCTSCKKGKMGKPKDPKTGKVKIRSKEYVCENCGHTEEKVEHEETLQVEIIYTCPHCKHEGEAEIPFKRKKASRVNPETGKRQAIEVLRFKCEKCEKDIDITKKMK